MDHHRAKAAFDCRCEAMTPRWTWSLFAASFLNRRSNILKPDESLLLRKPLMEVAHGGGRRLSNGDSSHVVLRDDGSRKA